MCLAYNNIDLLDKGTLLPPKTRQLLSGLQILENRPGSLDKRTVVLHISLIISVLVGPSEPLVDAFFNTRNDQLSVNSTVKRKERSSRVPWDALFTCHQVIVEELHAAEHNKCPALRSLGEVHRSSRWTKRPRQI